MHTPRSGGSRELVTGSSSLPRCWPCTGTVTDYLVPLSRLCSGEKKEQFGGCDVCIASRCAYTQGPHIYIPTGFGFSLLFFGDTKFTLFKSEGNQSNTYGHSQRHSIELSFPQVATEDGANHADQEPQQLGDKLGWEEEETVR